ncbi:40S ribosomal protein S10-A [Zancudomyces culisetae]|uniref:glucan endo-1,3-beta-D-glucosidase n=1 Tax=Zancudomyces culisetae TaxID=1213189 RepID=A0A1R1PJ93_ZANCU|nr:40S ribosomal protein S10-A [Zancudomyces culisetae]|eukprot:OMH80922.1 40S ribosomal protein S10-A [Zancudomyces culisetae]
MKSLFVLLCLLGEILARTWFDGLNYNPKQKDGSCPTVDTVRSDLSTMAPYTDTIKIFSVKDCNQGEPVLRAVEGTSWKVVLGMWVGPDDSAFNADVQELTRLNSVFDLKKYVKYVVVGSESLYRKDQTEDQLIAKINQARQLLNSLGLSSIPVTTADVYLNYSARLASAVDFVMMNAFTYWEGVPIEAAANTMFEHINAVKAISGGKRVVVGETGWPTGGSNFGAAVPSLANSARYMREFICRAHAEQIEYYWYAAIDTPWNTTPTNTVEAHFGILDADHNPKYPGDNWFACDNSSKKQGTIKMLIPQQNRKLIYEALFNEGVMVAKKDFNAPKHSELMVPNLQVIKALQSLNSRGYVKTQFSWQYYYYTLTDEGIEYLREYLHLPAEIVPATFKKPVRAQPTSSRFGRQELNYKIERDGEYPRRDRDEYRRRDDRKEGASGDFKPEFRGGAGRGRPQPR